jgi:hypothetical protein
MTDRESLSTRVEPERDRPVLPEDYGVPHDEDGLLPWSWAAERLERAVNYWFCTTRPDGRPHAMPAWAVWLDGALYFDGSPETRRMRNLARNPAIVVHLESGAEATIVEGVAHQVGRPSEALARQLAAAFGAKYGASHAYRPDPHQWDEGGLWVARPTVAFGWSTFPNDMTRWRFPDGRRPSPSTR